MLIGKMFGGLGNQMFIWAALRALSLRNKQNLYLDTYSGFTYDKKFHRIFALDAFNLKYNLAPRLYSWNFPGGRLSWKISMKLGRVLFNPVLRIIKEQSENEIDQRLFDPFTDNAYFVGYWQSEDYVSDCIDVIRNDFKFSKTVPPETREEETEIKKAGARSVFIGIRRYQECKNVPVKYLSSREYYAAAMKQIAQEVPDPVFFLFTQDHAWARENLPSGYRIVYIRSKEGDERAWEDLFLMSLCRHHIISHSTFYWWGGFLGEAGGITIAPPSPKLHFLCRKWRVLTP